MTDKPHVTGQRFEWLDALRGFAAVAVLLSHYYWTPLGKYEGPFHLMFSPGTFGVAVFFCISGFVITFSAERLKSRPVQSFMIGRIFRLYPAYWIAVALGLSVTALPLRDALINLTMVQQYVGIPNANDVFWTLQVELAFYTLIAVFIGTKALQAKNSFVVAAFALAGITLAFGLIRCFVGYKTPVSLSAGLAVMCASAVYFKHRIHGYLTDRQVTQFGAAIFALLALGWSLSFTRNWGHGEQKYWSSFDQITSYGVAILLFRWVMTRTDKPVWLLTYIGEISYSLYLVHAPVFEWSRRLIEPRTGFFIASLVAIVATFALSAATHAAIEKPMIAAGKWLVRRLSAAPAALKDQRRRDRRPDHDGSRGMARPSKTADLPSEP